jgi:hypothetical protein
MGSDIEAQDAMEGINRTELDGRIISVEKVQPHHHHLPLPPVVIVDIRCSCHLLLFCIVFSFVCSFGRTARGHT